MINVITNPTLTRKVTMFSSGINNPLRRRIIKHLDKELESSVVRLSEILDIDLHVIIKNVSILEALGLVLCTRKESEVTCSLRYENIEVIEGALGALELIS